MPRNQRPGWSWTACVRPFAAALLLAATAAAPARADQFATFFGCYFGCTSGSGSTTTGGSSGGGGTASATVPANGVVQMTYLVGGGFLPDRIRGKAGDTITIYNLTNSTTKVRATDNSWSSGYLSKNQSYSFVLQDTTKRDFQTSSSYSPATAKILLEDTPAAVDFGDLIDYQGMIVGNDGVIIREADGLGYSLAAVGGTFRTVVNGLTLGLTATLAVNQN